MLGPTLGLILVYFIVLGGAYYFGARTAFAKAFFKTSSPPAIAAVVLFVGLYLIVVTISAQFARSAATFAANVASATFGLTLGWVLGIVISPSSKDEASEFSTLTKAISTFFTGYILASLKGLDKNEVLKYLGDDDVRFRLLIGAACCLSSLAAVFVIRRAEVMAANAAREWFIRYTPADPKHAQALKGDFLARGPFTSRADALAEIALIKSLDEFKGMTLTAERVEIFSQEEVPAAGTTPAPSVGDDTAKQEATTTTEQAAATTDQTTTQTTEAPKTQAAGAGEGGGAAEGSPGAVPPNSGAEGDANATQKSAGAADDAQRANGAPPKDENNPPAYEQPKQG
jgi:hypothetical protein